MRNRTENDKAAAAARCALKRTVHKADYHEYKGLIIRFADTWMCETARLNCVVKAQPGSHNSQTKR